MSKNRYAGKVDPNDQEIKRVYTIQGHSCQGCAICSRCAQCDGALCQICGRCIICPFDKRCGACNIVYTEI